jgi:hypothetical protein
MEASLTAERAGTAASPSFMTRPARKNLAGKRDWGCHGARTKRDGIGQAQLAGGAIPDVVVDCHSQRAHAENTRRLRETARRIETAEVDANSSSATKVSHEGTNNFD